MACGCAVACMNNLYPNFNPSTCVEWQQQVYAYYGNLIDLGLVENVTLFSSQLGLALHTFSSWISYYPMYDWDEVALIEGLLLLLLLFLMMLLFLMLLMLLFLLLLRLLWWS